MVRLACVNVPLLPLQLLLQRHPAWAEGPVAVVAEEKAQSRILWVNAHARRRRILPGMRYGAALSLDGGLRAGVVTPVEIATGVRVLLGLLHPFSPHVEPAREQPGVFWLDGSGLGRLYRNPAHWARRIHETLLRTGFEAVVVVGFNRFASHAVARACRDVVVFADLQEERRTAAQVPLERMEVQPAFRDALHQLGIHTVAGLLRLPATGLLHRFGAEAYRMHRLASGALAEPLQPQPEALPVREQIALEAPEADAARLLFLIKARLEPLLARLTARGEALRRLHLRFFLEHRPALEAVVQPAAPTRDAALILDLARLRLERLELPAGVEALELEAEGAPGEQEQLSLFDDRPRRDLAAASRALARVRAEFGASAVVRAVLREGHLPEARFAWEPLTVLKSAAPRPVSARTLVRRLFDRPRPLARMPAGPFVRAGSKTRKQPAGGYPAGNHEVKDGAWKGDAWKDGAGAETSLGRAVPGRTPSFQATSSALAAALAGALGEGPLAALHGPYPLSGGWWARWVRRTYYFAETRNGALLWLFHDRRRGRWFLHGRVE